MTPEEELRSLREENLWYRQALEAAAIGTYKWDSLEDRWYWSDRVYDLRGFEHDTRNAAPGPFYARVHPDDREMLYAAEVACKEGLSPMRVEYRFVLPSGDVRWHRELADLIVTGDRRLLLGVLMDVTEERLRAEQLELHSRTDDLTGVMNRAGFDRHLEDAVRTADSEGSSLVLAFADLNGFKAVNDRFGHKAGDRVLQIVAAALSDHRPPGSEVARIGGDEFVLLSATPDSNVARTRQSVQTAIERAFAQVAEQAGEMAVGTTAGISSYPRPAATATELLTQADAAMYAAKRAGGQVVVFEYRPPGSSAMPSVEDRP